MKPFTHLSAEKQPMSLLVKYLKGWLTPETFEVHSTLNSWYNDVKELEKDFEIVVFKVPKKNAGKLVAGIERYLQSEVPEPS